MGRLRPDGLTIGLLVILALTVGCGDSNKVPSLRSSGPITTAEAMAFARAVNLGVADAPQMRSLGLENTVRRGRAEHEQNRCVGGAPFGIVDRRSPRFVQGTVQTGVEEVASTVQIARTAADASKDLAAERRVPTSPCIKPLIERATAEDAPRGFRYGPTRIAPLSDLLPRVSVIGFRISTERLSPLRRHVYNDFFLFVVGRAEVELEAFGSIHPPSPANERRLLSQLYGRAKSGAG